MNKLTHHITYKGETHTIPEWAAKLGMTISCLENRVARGWNAERIFTEPVNLAIAKRCLSKCDCQRELDLTPFVLLHPKIQKFFKATTYRGSMFGRELQDRNRPLFNWYYEKAFDKNREPEKVEVCA